MRCDGVRWGAMGCDAMRCDVLPVPGGVKVDVKAQIHCPKLLKLPKVKFLLSECYGKNYEDFLSWQNYTSRGEIHIIRPILVGN